MTTDGNSSPADLTLSNTPATAAGSDRSARMCKGLEEVSADDGVERDTVATRYPASTKPLASAVPMLEPTPKMTATSEFGGAIVDLCLGCSGCSVTAGLFYCFLSIAIVNDKSENLGLAPV